MLDAIIGQDPLDAETWDINGGWTTREQLNDMEFEAYEELVRWMAALPLYAVAETEERPYLLVHAGIQTEAARAFLLEHGVECGDGRGAVDADSELLRQMLAVQSSDDLLWIRHGYWDAPTGLLSAEGEGPVVVSGHTPTVSLGRYCEVGGLAGLDEESGRGQIVRLGGEDTAGVPDRIDIDCAAATGSEFGRVGSPEAPHLVAQTVARVQKYASLLLRANLGHFETARCRCQNIDVSFLQIDSN